MKGYLENSSLSILSSSSRSFKKGYISFINLKLREGIGLNILTDLTFYYTPKSKIQIAVTSNAIENFYSSYIISSNFEINIESNYAFIFEINFRECLFGEYFRSDLHT